MQYLNKPVAAICLAVASAFVQAQEATYDFNLPAQPAGHVLNALTKQTGLQPFYSEDSVKGVQSPGVKGKYSLREALDKALVGTGLSYQFTAEKAVAIKAAPAEKVAELAAIEVKDEALTPYITKRSSAGTKTDTSIMELPASLQFVSRTVMDDQQVVSVKDAVKNVSGVHAANNGFYDSSFLIRGFENGYGAIFRNGLQQQAQLGTETANIERIEILKGPAASLYGKQEGPGGVINLVTKRPQADTVVNIEQQLGSYNFKKTILDATGALNDEKTLMYRFVGTYKDNESFVDFEKQNRKFGSLSFLWKPNAQFEGNINFEHHNETMTGKGYLGIPFIGSRPAEVPINRNYGDPIQNEIPTYQNRDMISGDWTYHFNSEWKVTQHFMYEQRKEQHNSIDGGAFDPVTGNYSREVWRWNVDRNITALDQNISGRFDALGARHNAMVGFDYWKYDFNNAYSYWDMGAPFVPDINIYHPVYGLDWSAMTLSGPDKKNLTVVGYYFQDQIEIENWRVLVGGRYDKFNDDQNNGGVTRSFHDTGFSPRLAVLYQITPTTSVFAGFNKSLGTNNGYQSDGKSIPPEGARQYEAGLKVSSFEDRLLTTITVFDLAKTNIKNPDPSNPLFSVATGEMRNKGVELDVVGNLGGGFSVIGSYAYFNALITKDTKGNQGNTMPNVPTHSANLWGKYDRGTAKQGWGVGFGANIRSERQANNENTRQLPGYAIFNAMAEYRFAVNDTLLKAKLNVDNLTDKIYWDHATPNWGGAYYGTPRTFRVSISADF